MMVGCMCRMTQYGTGSCIIHLHNEGGGSGGGGAVKGGGGGQ